MKHTRNPFVRGLALSQSDSTTLAIQKNLSAHGSSFGFASLLSISALVLLGSPNAQAANATWNGTTDATWATGTNWSTTPVPGNGNTATFNNAGGAIDTITTGAITINTILFDTASVAAYILGGATAGTGTITLNDTGAITMNSTVANDQLINANIVLGLNKTAQSYSITNNSNTSNLTLAGTISSTNNPMTGGIKTLNINGAGNVLLSGVISNGTATGVAINKS